MRSNSKDHTTYARYSHSSKEWPGGFGRQVLGETWVSHHGHHGHESTRGMIAAGMQDHPIVRGITRGYIYGPTDVYTVKLPLQGDSQPIVHGPGAGRDEPARSTRNGSRQRTIR